MINKGGGEAEVEGTSQPCVGVAEGAEGGVHGWTRLEKHIVEEGHRRE